MVNSLNFLYFGHYESNGILAARMNKLNCLQTEGNSEKGFVQNLYVDESGALV